MRQKFVPATAAAVGMAMVLMAAPASAARPHRTVALAEPIFLPAGLVCPFAVAGEPDEDTRTATTEFSDGRIQTVGHGEPTLTNVSTGESYLQRSRYESTTTYDPVTNDVVDVISGRFFIGLFEGDQGPAGLVGENGALLAIAGHLALTLDLDTGVLTSFDLVGQSMDLCAALSDGQ